MPRRPPGRQGRRAPPPPPVPRAASAPPSTAGPAGTRSLRPAGEHRLGRCQALQVPAHHHHLHGAAGRPQRRPQAGMRLAPRADPARRHVLRLDEYERRPLGRGPQATCARSTGCGSPPGPGTPAAAAPPPASPPPAAPRPCPPRSPATAPRGDRLRSRGAATAAEPLPATPRAGAGGARYPAPGQATEAPPCTAASTRAKPARPAPAGRPSARPTRGTARRSASQARGGRRRRRPGTARAGTPTICRQTRASHSASRPVQPKAESAAARPPRCVITGPSPLVTIRSPWRHEMTLPIGSRTTSSAPCGSAGCGGIRTATSSTCSSSSRSPTAVAATSSACFA